MIEASERHEEHRKRPASKKSSKLLTKKVFSRNNLMTVVFEPLGSSLPSGSTKGKNCLFFQPHDVVERRHIYLALEEALGESDQPPQPVFSMKVPEGLHKQLFRVGTNPNEENPTPARAISPSSGPLSADNAALLHSTGLVNGVESRGLHAASQSCLTRFYTQNGVFNDSETVLVPLTYAKGLKDDESMEDEDPVKTTPMGKKARDFCGRCPGGVSWIRLKKDLHSVFRDAYSWSTPSAVVGINFLPLQWEKDQLCNIEITPVSHTGFKFLDM
ncbi:unnamed protein product [Phytomonas sp. Hart1]|nr:unnamed protein product [Phytomonas sp. Hart1]|eukprot:CCW66933.1 unnamed protein product [Phytomonas sp. isolate Hart1]